MDFTDMVPISLCLSRLSLLIWSGEQSVGAQAALMPGAHRVLQGPGFPDPSHTPSGSGFGVCNKDIILKKNMKDNH